MYMRLNLKCKIGIDKGGNLSYKTVKKTIDFCEKGPFKLISPFDYYFLCFDHNRMSSELYNVPRMKVVIFADLLYFHIVIVKNTQVQYFDNLKSSS